MPIKCVILLDHLNLYSGLSDTYPIPCQVMTITTSHSQRYLEKRPLKNTGHLLLKRKSRQDRGFPFSPSFQHVNNTEMMLQCQECGQWRLIYAIKKLSCTQKQQLERVLDHISFSCGTQLQDYPDLPQDMMDTVFTRL